MGGTSTSLIIWRNQKVDPKLNIRNQSDHPDANAALDMANPEIAFTPSYPIKPINLDLHFPQGQGWQTLELTLTW